MGPGAFAACSRAAPGEVGRCAAAWPARRVGRRGSRHPGMLQLQPGRGGGADCCAPGSQLGREDLRWSGREGSRGPQNRGPAAPERRWRRFKLAPVNFFFFSLIIVIVLRLNLRIFLHLEGPALNGLEGARSPSAAGSRVPEALILQSLLSCQSWPRILLTSGFHPVSPSYPSPHLLLQDSTSDSLSKSCPEEIGSG